MHRSSFIRGRFASICRLALGLTLAVTRAKAWVSRRFGEESGSQILVSLLIPGVVAR